MESNLHRLLKDILTGIMVVCARRNNELFFGWNGHDDFQASSKLLGTLIALRSAGIDRNLLIEMNDTGFTFDEIADYIDKVVNDKSW